MASKLNMQVGQQKTVGSSKIQCRSITLLDCDALCRRCVLGLGVASGFGFELSPEESASVIHIGRTEEPCLAEQLAKYCYPMSSIGCRVSMAQASTVPSGLVLQASLATVTRYTRVFRDCDCSDHVDQRQST